MLDGTEAHLAALHRCKAEPPVLHGPYLHWTRTLAGKTVTRTLTQEQASRYQPWFDNARRLREEPGVGQVRHDEPGAGQVRPLDEIYSLQRTHS